MKSGPNLVDYASTRTELSVRLAGGSGSMGLAKATPFALEYFPMSAGLYRGEAASADKLRHRINLYRLNTIEGENTMKKLLISFLLLCVSLCAQAGAAHAASLADRDRKPEDTPANALNPVIQWNRMLLMIVRTPGAQPATVHSTRNFAIMHAAMYDAVNAIDARHKPYLVTVPEVSPNASQQAAAAAAAHEVLVRLYPAFKAQLDGELQQSLAQIAAVKQKTECIAIGLAVADRILALRSNDGSSAPPIPYVF